MNYFKNIFRLLIYFSIIYYLPRFLIDTLGPENPWTSFFYMYSLGGLVFLIGLNIILKSKACNLNLKSDRIWLRATILGFFYFLSLHGIWIYFSLNTSSAL